MAGLSQKYRPRRFVDVVGQTPVRFVLQRAVAAQRVPQQLMFAGGSGLGKTTMARITAAAMLCDNPLDGDACGECPSCHDVYSPTTPHPDVIEFDAASYGNKDQIRDLAQRAALAPMRGRYRIYIVDEAQGLSQAGSEAFLKLLETPPPHVHFMLATTDPDKVLRTVRGRCVEFSLERPGEEELRTFLGAVAEREGLDLPRDVADAVMHATGDELGVRGLLMSLEKVTDALAWGEHGELDVVRLLGLPPRVGVQALWAAVCQGDPAGVLTALTDLRTSVSDQVIRRTVIDIARRILLDNPSDLAALTRLQTVLDAAPGPVWTDVTLMRLAHAAAPAQTRQVPSPTHPTQQTQGGDGSTPSTSTGVRRKERSVPDRDRHDTSGSAPRGRTRRTAGDGQQQPDRTPATPSSDSTQPAGGQSGPEARPAVVTELITRVSARDKTAAALLRACRLDVSGSKIRVSPPDGDTAERLKVRAQAVKDAAAELEVTLTLTRPVS